MDGAERCSSSRDAEPSINQYARLAMSVLPDEIVSSFRHSANLESSYPVLHMAARLGPSTPNTAG